MNIFNDVVKSLYSSSLENNTYSEVKSIALPLVRHVFPRTIAEDIVSVQPMSDVKIEEYKTKRALREAFRKLSKTRYKTYISG